MDVRGVSPNVVKTPGLWWWLIQRLSGLLLIFLVLAHGWFTHFVPIGDFAAGVQEEVVVFDVVKRRLAQTAFILLDFFLLAVVFLHGLNGIRNILMEWRPTRRLQGVVTVLLWATGVLAFGLGARALLVFIL